MALNNVTTSAPNHTITLIFSDPDSGVNTNTLDNASLVLVTGPNSFDKVASIVAGTKIPATGNANIIQQSYLVDGPFASGDNGTYTVSLEGGILADAAATPNVRAAFDIDTFECFIPAASSFPVMTAADEPAPASVTQSSADGARVGWLAFNGATNNFWRTASGGHLNCWVALDVGADATAGQVDISAPSGTFNETRLPKDFNIEYSANGSDWDIALAVTGETGWSEGETRNFTFATQTARYWRIFVIDNNNNNFLTEIANILFAA